MIINLLTFKKIGGWRFELFTIIISQGRISLAVCWFVKGPNTYGNGLLSLSVGTFAERMFDKERDFKVLKRK